ncbi:hypothetical protein HYU09_00030 [Candidatus Woesearchaeota archaeon]|nr:hypothetical protein [Candidatus Woesearchaeota archaeon]
MKKNRVEALLYLMLALIAVISVMNILIIQGRAEKVEEAREIAKEFLRPADLEVIKILLSDCGECFDIEAALENIKKQNVNVTRETAFYFNEDNAKALVEKYGIKKIPTIIISGEVNKTEQLKAFFGNIGDFPDERNTIFTALEPPYYDVASAKVVGKVSVINVVDSSCEECIPLSQLADALKQSGVAVTEEKTHEYNSKEGIELISKFGISRIPAILISNEVNYYDGFKEQMQQLAEEKNGYYALHATSAPYRDLSKGEVVGLVKIILLDDNSCAECYDVSINSQILPRFGVFVDEESYADISSPEGMELISKYNIEKVPALLLSPEASEYPALVQVWQSVGTVEDDGWYIMREPENIGTYRNLKTNEIVQVQ